MKILKQLTSPKIRFVRLGSSTLFLVALITAPISPVIAEQPGYDMDALDSGQAELANQMLQFIDEMDNKHFSLVEKLNGNRDVESTSFQDENSDYEIRVVRGDVIEKSGFTTSVTKLGVAPYTEDALWSRVVTINTHATTPLVGYLHAFVSFQYNVNGTSSIGGWMDVIPAVRTEEDLAYIRQRVDAVFEKHGVDPGPYRKAVCSGQRREHLHPACVGVSFYAPPFLSITGENLALVNETFAALFDAYAVILERRQGQDYSEDDVIVQEGMRRKWLEDQMMYDPYAQNVIPHEVRSVANYPPSVEY